MARHVSGKTHLKAGESFKVSCNVCGKEAYIDNLQVMENINKVYGTVHCTDKSCGSIQILDGTLPKRDKITL